MSTDERYFLLHTMEAQFLNAFPQTPPAVLEAYRAAGFDPARKLPAYEYAIWRRCLAVQREAFFPGLPPDEGYEALGRQYSASYLETTMGRALSVLLKLLSTRRMFGRLERVFRSGNTFSRVSVSDESPSELLLEVNDVFCESPRYLVGMLERGFAAFGREVKLTPRAHAQDRATFHVRFS
ncbi:MAG: DUF2378 family protein [Myxococcus sp.]|nr:DUF2378 family protein [Myxococcus sp.]